MTANEDISIRHCQSLDEFEQCVSVQKSVWGFADAELIPQRFFVVASKIEGQVIGAFDKSDKLVGFCLAVPALRGETVHFHSHMLAVLPELRHSGVGRRLKLEQRRDALVRGIRLVEWTFDPLEWKNASFNLNRLGAIARRYVPNQYGISSSPLHRGLPTDRLIAEWWLESPRVQKRAADPSYIPKLVGDSTGAQHIAVPLDTARSGRPLAEVQLSLRDAFQRGFAEGLAAVGLEIAGQSGNYTLVNCEAGEAETLRD